MVFDFIGLYILLGALYLSILSISPAYKMHMAELNEEMKSYNRSRTHRSIVFLLTFVIVAILWLPIVTMTLFRLK